MKILSAAQIRNWDVFTIENEPISSLELMERAAGKCTAWILSNANRDRKFKIFCGKGNNGGDGLAIARQLAEKDIIAEVYILEFGALGTPDFQANLKRLHAYPNAIHFLQDETFFPAIDESDIVIDAIYGSGVDRTLEGLSAALVNHINLADTFVISIDLPSGLISDKPTNSNAVVRATLTLTFQTLKLAFLIAENGRYIGKVHILNIGLHLQYLQTIQTRSELLHKDKIRNLYRPRSAFSHKGTFGHALIIAGEKGKMGAAILATKACLRSGVGLVTAAVPEAELLIIQNALLESMAIVHDEVNELEWNKFASIGIGPGLGTTNKSEQLLQILLSSYFSPCVFDADALNVLANNPLWQNELPPNSIITPHPKEFDRLFGRTNNDFERIELAIKKSRELHINIILKGHHTFIALPNGKAYFNSTGNPGMATGGSGDVLTGILAGLLAQGYDPADASILGVYLHGLAGDLAAARLSQEAMLAGDLIKFLGKAFLEIQADS
ncbi:MAG: NAD(P)H-hydrate dehydratase [Segetibacter sp.]|nr:NAD(P)H-hydrate dehydratase [Segetibacter sp.]